MRKAGRWIKFTSSKEISALQARLSASPEVKEAFEALTPGRAKSHIFHVSGAKQPETRAARAAKCVPIILSGRGFNERAG